MRKIKEENLEGRSRDERETCFPAAHNKKEMKGAGLR